MMVMYKPRRHGWQLPLHRLQALSVAVLFIRCTATDPSDKARYHRKTMKIKKKSSSLKLNYGFLLGQILIRAFRRMERKFLKTCIRRKYSVLTPHVHLQPLLPFPLVIKDDYDHQEDLEDLEFCSLCNFQ
ncbi:hypothetical protein KSS87_022117, partial [Heliosperma pusillum]